MSNFKICAALTNDLEVVCVAVADAVDADEDGDGEKDQRGDGVGALVRCVQRAVVPGEVDGGEVFGEAGNGDGGEVAVGAVSAGREPKMRSGSGTEPSRSLGMAAMRALTSASRESLKSAASAVLGKSVTLPVSLVFDGGDAVLADAEGVVAAEGHAGVRGVQVHVRDGECGREARDFDGRCAGVCVGVALEDPGLVERVHGAPLGFAVDAEVVADVGVEERAADVPLVLGVRDGDEQLAAVGVGMVMPELIQKGAMTSWPL